MRILYYHVPEIKDYMRPTANLMQVLRNAGFNVINCVTNPDDSYSMGNHLKDNWELEDLIIIGQDNLPTIKMIEEMASCEYDLCVNPCISYPASTALDRPMLNQIDENGRMYEMSERPRFVDYGGTGVSKISLHTQIHHPEILKKDFGFPAFDSTLYADGLKKWHCHYPIHKHMKDLLEYKHWQNSS